MTRLRAAFFAIFLVVAPAFAAAENQCKANGCGPDGFIGRLVPNHFFHQCEFEECCDGHDKCYGRCLDCGDLHGKPECNDKAKRKARRAICDNTLYDDINRLNANRTLCQGFAFAYWTAVSVAGDGFFRGIVMSAEAESKFRTDFNAALAYYEFEKARGRDAELAEARSAIKLLSRLDGIEKNGVAFRVSEDRGVLAVESQDIRSSPRVELPGALAVEKQKFLNGVDVTRMEYAGQRFDLENAIRDLKEPGVDIRTLQQKEQFVPVR